MSQPSLPYDPTDRDSIVRYAERLVGHSLRDVLESLPSKIDFSSHKGGFGNALERYYFGYEPNNRPEPDFAAAGVELKATPLRRSEKGLIAKERLVLGMIDYMTIVSEEWESSSFLRKNAHLLLVFYLHEEGRDPRDFAVKIVRLWEFPEADLEVIRDDWERIVEKVREGRAHEISEGDTLYLAACTKGATGADRRGQPFSDDLAKPRAFSLKASYMNSIIADSLDRRSAVSVAELRAGRTFEEVVHDRFLPFVGMTDGEIAERLGVTISRRAKSFRAVLTARILGVATGDEVPEFTKAGIIPKTVVLRQKGTLKEAVPFPAFDYCALVKQDWVSSDLRSDLTSRFFFVVFQNDEHGVPRLDRTQFWTMPIADVDQHARECFDQTVSLIMEDRADYLPTATDNKTCHVRPHGRNHHDVVPTPTGRSVMRKSFWLNKAYMAEQLSSGEDS